MKLTIISLFLLFWVCQSTFMESASVVILDDSNFNEFIQLNHPTMVFFYTPGCGPCEKLIPEVEKAAHQMRDEGIVFAKLEAEGNKDTAKFYGVNSYPSMIWFEDGENRTRYDGGRTHDAVKLWVYEQINPGSQELKTIKEIKKEIASQRCIFLFFAQENDRTFRKYRDYSFSNGVAIFRHTFLKGAAKELGLPDKTQYAAFKKYDQSTVIFQPKQFKISDLTAFTELNMLPRITQWTQDVELRVMLKERQALILFTNGDEKAEKAFEEFAFVNQMYKYKNFPLEDYVIFIGSTPSTSDSKSRKILTERFGIFESQIDEGALLLMVQKNATQKYLLQKEFTPKNIESFLYDCRDGKAKQHFRSQQQAPVYEDLKYLTAFTGETYNSQMLDSAIDWVVIYFNSKEEAHKDVLQVVNKVASRFAKNKNVLFAITEANLNEYTDFSENLDIVKIRIYKGVPGKKQFLRFAIKSNKIQADRLINFVYDHTSYEWVEVRDDL